MITGRRSALAWISGLAAWPSAAVKAPRSATLAGRLSDRNARPAPDRPRRDARRNHEEVLRTGRQSNRTVTL